MCVCLLWPGIPLLVYKYIHIGVYNVSVGAYKYYIYTSFWNIMYIRVFMDTLLPKNHFVKTSGCVHTMCTSVSGYFRMEYLSVCPSKFISVYRMCRLAHTNTTYTHHSETYCTYTWSWIPFSQKIISSWQVGVYTRCVHLCLSTWEWSTSRCVQLNSYRSIECVGWRIQILHVHIILKHNAHTHGHGYPSL